MDMTHLPTCHPVTRNPKIMLPGFMKGRYCQDNLDISMEGCIQMPRNTKNLERKPTQHRPTYLKIGARKFSLNPFRDHMTMTPEWTITIRTIPHTL